MNDSSQREDKNQKTRHTLHCTHTQRFCDAQKNKLGLKLSHLFLVFIRSFLIILHHCLPSFHFIWFGNGLIIFILYIIFSPFIGNKTNSKTTAAAAHRHTHTHAHGKMKNSKFMPSLSQSILHMCLIFIFISYFIMFNSFFSYIYFLFPSHRCLCTYRVCVRISLCPSPHFHQQFCLSSFSSQTTEYKRKKNWEARQRQHANIFFNQFSHNQFGCVRSRIACIRHMARI